MKNRATKIYAFDFDDNIVTTNAKIRTKKGLVSTAEFAVRTFRDCDLEEDAFQDFRNWRECTLKKSTFFDVFIKALDERNPTLVLSARSLNQRDFRALLRRAAGLAKRRLHPEVYTIGANNSRMIKRFPSKNSGERKGKILLDFIRQFPRHLPFGFSDDDPKNLKSVIKILRPISKKRKIYIFNSRNNSRRILK